MVNMKRKLGRKEETPARKQETKSESSKGTVTINFNNTLLKVLGSRHS